MQIAIRTMQASDLETVEALDRMSFTMPWPRSAYSYELHENPMSMLWVAELTGSTDSTALTTNPGQAAQVIGMVVVWLIIDEAHIATIAVHPELRGQGIARQLLKTALLGAIERGMLSATLEVRVSNEPARRLYQRFKFEEVGRRPRYYRDNNEDALIMTVEGLGPAYRDWLERDGLAEPPPAEMQR